MYFQDIISSLNNFWSERGCLLLQPYDLEKGAGTMSPHSFLRAIGPEPWAVAYPEPCRRPTDGRYGDKPNRAQHYFQYQVLIKPSLDGIQEIYLSSLEALGISAKDHDIRFVEDNWESPTLGAWGVGWEVWLDGMEVTQFTYFQQCGGLDCKPVSIEITYGLERLAMYLQNVESIWNLSWNKNNKYGDIWLPFEKGQCKYNFEESNSDNLRKLFDIYEEEANQIQELYLSGKKDKAEAIFPTELLDDLTLVGTKEEIKEKYKIWKNSNVTELSIGLPVDLETIRYLKNLNEET